MVASEGFIRLGLIILILTCVAIKLAATIGGLFLALVLWHQMGQFYTMDFGFMLHDMDGLQSKYNSIAGLYIYVICLAPCCQYLIWSHKASRLDCFALFTLTNTLAGLLAISVLANIPRFLDEFGVVYKRKMADYEWLSASAIDEQTQLARLELDNFQSSHLCCGLNSIQDWDHYGGELHWANNITYPLSCCPPGASSCRAISIHYPGCSRLAKIFAITTVELVLVMLIYQLFVSFKHATPPNWSCLTSLSSLRKLDKVRALILGQAEGTRSKSQGTNP